jgi:dTDP-4-dehydrorhamnose reductase
VYGVRGGNFAKTMIRLAQERQQLTVIQDQRGAPTGAELLADVTALALHRVVPDGGQSLSGLYHLVAAGQTSWHDYAVYAIAQARRLRPDLAWKVKEIVPVASSAFKTTARRPLNSLLNTDRIQRSFGVCLPDWKTGVDRMLKEYLT